MESGNDLKSINVLLEKLDKSKYTNTEDNFQLGMKVYSLCKESDYEIGMAFALLRIGVAYVNMSKYEEALPFLIDSINLAKKLNICDLQVTANINIGNVFYDIGQYEKSMDYYNTSKKIAKLISVSENYYKDASYELYAAKISNNIGEIYKILNCYSNALFYYNKSISYDEKLSSHEILGVALANIGDIKYRLGEYDEALEYINKSIDCELKHNYKISLSESYRILALIYEKKGNYSGSMEYYTKAISIASEVGYIYNKINALLDYSKFLIITENSKESEKILEEAFTISIDNKMLIKTLEICKIFIKINEDINNTKKAYKFYKLYFEYEKKLEFVESEKKANNLKIKIRLEQVEKENKKILEKSENIKKKSEELIETIKNVSIISELGQKITSTLDLNEIFEMIYNSIQTFMKISAFGIGLYDVNRSAVHYEYYMENNKPISVKDAYIDNKSSIAAKCIRERRVIVINDMSSEYIKYVDALNYLNLYKNDYNNSKINSLIYMPLIIDNSLIGVITIQAYKKNAFTNIHIEMIKALTAYAAIGVNNAIKSMNLQVEVEQRRKIQIELEKINNTLLYLSENDGLTSIANRRKFDDVINTEWAIAQKLEKNISIIIFDVDCFKQYNDNYGHIEGDSCLVSICKLLTSLLQGNYFAARYGGDEFIIILPSTNLDEAISFGDDFRKKIENLRIAHEYSNVNDNVTVSMGCASVVPNSKISIYEFIRQADNALYSAKRNGRNQIKRFNPHKKHENN